MKMPQAERWQQIRLGHIRAGTRYPDVLTPKTIAQTIIGPLRLGMVLALLGCADVPKTPSHASCASVGAAIGILEASENRRAINRTGGFLVLGIAMSLLVPFSGFLLTPIDLATAKSDEGRELDRLRSEAEAMECLN